MYQGEGYYFCGNCDEYDSMRLINKRVKRNALSHKCKANHTSFHFPTDKSLQNERADYLPSRKSKYKGLYASQTKNTNQMKKNVNVNNQKYSEEMVPPPIHDRSLECVYDKDMAKNLLDNLAHVKEQLISARNRIFYLENQLRNQTSVVHSGLSIAECMNIIRAKKLSTISKDTHAAKKIACALFEDNCMNGLLKKELIELSKKWIRTNIYNPQNILRVMDVSGGAINYHCIELLRSIESQNRPYFSCILPSSSAIKRAAKKLEDYAMKVIPYDIYNHGNGEGFKFDFKKLFVLLSNSFKLTPISIRQALDWLATIDGSQITKHTSHLLCSMKLNDVAARDPITSTPCFINLPPTKNDEYRSDLDLENSLMEYKSFQSHNYCFPFQCQLVKETKQSYTYFEDFFKFVRELSESGSVFGIADANPVNINNIADLSAHWKGLKKGSGTKNNSARHRMSCPIIGKDIHRANPQRCHRWCQLRPLHYKCHHHELVTEESLSVMEKN